MLKSIRHAAFFRLVLFGAVLAGMLLALVLAASPELHERLHHEADHQAHQCLATTIGSGACEESPGPAMVSAVLPLQLEMASPVRHPVLESLFLMGGVLEHAPPAFLS